MYERKMDMQMGAIAMHRNDASEICKRFGESFKYHRERLGISHKELADACGFSVGIQGKWERGECCPGLYCLASMAEYMGLTIDELVGMEGSDADG